MSWRDLDESDVRVRPNPRGSRRRTKERPAHADAVPGFVIGVDRGRYAVLLAAGVGGRRMPERTVTAMRARELGRKSVVVGDDVAMANEVYVMDSNSHGVEGRPHVEAPVHIGDGTWLGARVMVLPGVTIGKRVLVAAGSVVTRDVPDDVMVAGNPARVVRSLAYPPGCRRAWHDAWCPCPKVAAVEGAVTTPGSAPLVEDLPEEESA